MAARWTWYLDDAQGNALCELTSASARLLAFKRNTAAVASFTLSHRDVAAQLLLDALQTTGIPTLRCYRRQLADPAGVLRFRGHLAPFQEHAEEASTLQLTFASPLARVLGDGSGRGRFTGPAVTFTQTDAGQIAKQLVDTTNAEGATGLATTGTIAATKLRDRAYAYANVGEAITNLTNVLDGFDMYETFLDNASPTLAALNIVAAQGEDQPDVRFEYGPGTLNNARAFSRTTQPPINVARVLGANGLYAEKSDAASIATYGRWMVQQSATDVTEQATLDDKAQALLRPRPVKTVQFVPELGLDSCPRPWDDFWLGDTCRVVAARDAFTEDASVRLNAITVAINDDGYEVATVEREDAIERARDPSAVVRARGVVGTGGASAVPLSDIRSILAVELLGA